MFHWSWIVQLVIHFFKKPPDDPAPLILKETLMMNQSIHGFWFPVSHGVHSTDMKKPRQSGISCERKAGQGRGAAFVG